MLFNVKAIAEEFCMKIVAGNSGINNLVKGFYCGDLLSEVMGNASENSLWITVQIHQNIIAVAVLKEMSAIIIAGGYDPDSATIEKANQEQMPVLLWPGSAFDIAGKLYSINIIS